MKLLQFTDLHIGDYPHHEDDLRTFKLVEAIVKQEKPDLIVLTGDNLWTHGVKNIDEARENLFKVFNDLETPIALTYGNHDSEDRDTRTDLREMEQALKYVVKKENQMIFKDRECYTITLNDHVLFFVDTGANSDIGLGEWAHIETHQVEWFNEITRKLGRNESHFDLMFMHIPLPEYAMGTIIEGVRNETVNSPVLNTGMVANIIENGNVKATFCGHDHDNDAVIDFLNVKLIYGRVSGYQCYGDLKRGARVIKLSKDNLETHIVEHIEL